MERILETPAELAPVDEVVPEPLEETIEISASVHYAYQTLYFAFIALLGLFGLDKFLHMLANWDQYVAPQITGLTSFHGQFITMFAGLVEVVLAVCVGIRPRAAAWLVAGWFSLVAINLVMRGGVLELAVMNAFIAVVAVAFGFLAQECN